MTDWPEAVREAELAANKAWNEDRRLMSGVAYAAIAKQTTAIAALKEMVERERSWQADGEPDMVRVQRERAEQAEAEVERLDKLGPISRRQWMMAMDDINSLKDLLDKACKEMAELGAWEHHYFPETPEAVKEWLSR